MTFADGVFIGFATGSLFGLLVCCLMLERLIIRRPPEDKP